MAITIDDLRAELARHRLRLYEIAPQVGLHPTHLGSILNGRRPLRPELAERLVRAIQARVEEAKAATR